MWPLEFIMRCLPYFKSFELRFFTLWSKVWRTDTENPWFNKPHSVCEIGETWTPSRIYLQRRGFHSLLLNFPNLSNKRNISSFEALHCSQLKISCPLWPLWAQFLTSVSSYPGMLSKYTSADYLSLTCRWLSFPLECLYIIHLSKSSIFCLL